MSNTPAVSTTETGSAYHPLLAVGVLVHVLFLLSLVLGFLNPLFDDASHRSGKGADFFAVYQAAQNAQDGVSVYGYEVENQVVPYYYPYRYLPFSAFTIGQVLLLFTPHMAYGIWILFNEILLGINLAFTFRLVSNSRRRSIILSMWLLFSPLYIEYYMGQFSFLMASLLFWTILFWMRRLPVKGNAWWIVSLLIKSNSAILLPVLAKMNKWRTILLGAIIVSVLSVPYFLSQPGSFDAFSLNFAEGLSVTTVGGNQGFPALIAVLIVRLKDLWPATPIAFSQAVPVMDEIIRLPLLIWMGLLICWNLILTIRSSKQTTVELSLLWLLTYFLVYKHVWEHQYVMMLPVFVLLYVVLGHPDRRQWINPGIFWGTFCCIALPTLFWFFDIPRLRPDPEYVWSGAQAILFHLFKPLAVLMLYAALSTALWKHGRSPGESVRTKGQKPVMKIQTV